MHPVGVEPKSARQEDTATCVEWPTPSVAKSGAVGDTGQNLEVLAALVGILTPEQKAAFLALLTAQKLGAHRWKVTPLPPHLRHERRSGVLPSAIHAMHTERGHRTARHSWLTFLEAHGFAVAFNRIAAAG